MKTNFFASPLIIACMYMQSTYARFLDATHIYAEQAAAAEKSIPAVQASVPDQCCRVWSESYFGGMSQDFCAILPYQISAIPAHLTVGSMACGKEVSGEVYGGYHLGMNCATGIMQWAFHNYEYVSPYEVVLEFESNLYTNIQLYKYDDQPGVPRDWT